MGLQLRIEYPGALYHVMSHGNGFQWIYKDAEQYFEFVKLLLKVKAKYQFNIHAFILMRNHYHILIETPLGNLSRGMLYLNREFARRFNLQKKRIGSVFTKRYKSILIEKEEYYKTVYRYINQNAIRIKLNKKVEDYPGGLWYYGVNFDNGLFEKQINRLINWDDIYNYLGIHNRKKIVKWLNESLEENIGNKQRFKHLWGSKKWLNQIKKKYIDKENYNSNIKESAKMRNYNKEVWKKYKALKNYKKDKDYKNLCIYILSNYSQMTQKEIAERLEIRNSNAVGQRLYKIRTRLKRDDNFKGKIKEIEESKK